MTRAFKINGAALVKVKGNISCPIAALSELGLAQDAIDVTFELRHKDLKVDAWGEAPPDVQMMLATATITMNLIHYYQDVLAACIREACGGASAEGTMPRAGLLMGGNAVRFDPLNHYIGLNILSPVEALPWRFFTAYLSGNAMRVPIGTERKVIPLTWRAIPYGGVDPWSTGLASEGQPVYDRTLDT